MADTTAPTTAAPVTPTTAPTTDSTTTGTPAEKVAEVKEAIRKMKIKVDGKEEELDESEIIKLAQLGRGSNKRFEEAKQMRQQAEQFIAMLKKDPKAVLSNPALGVDLRKFAEQIVWEHIQDESLSPEQKRARDIEKELQKYKEQEELTKKEQAEQQMQALHQRYAQDYDRKITSALQNSGLPKTPSTVKRMAEYMFTAVQNGYDLEPSDLVHQVRKDYEQDIREMFGQVDGDTLLSLLGEDTAKKIRNTDLKRLKSTQGKVVKEPKAETSSKPGPKPKKLKGHEWRESLMKEMMGR